MTKAICLWEAPRSRGTSISYALFHGLRAQGYQCVYRDRCASTECLGLGTAYIAKFGYDENILNPLPGPNDTRSPVPIADNRVP